mmetsp:Transcript_4670/g.18641  ORF Transcript_4670/g.18641 Transcript_4670/m.18641 type:complete len:767 (-) Transcript_4670:387-2687(-)
MLRSYHLTAAARDPFLELLRRFFGEQEFSDVCLRLQDGSEVQIHRVMLAVRCPTLLRCVHESRSEAGTFELVPDSTFFSARDATMQLLLKHLYTGEVATQSLEEGLDIVALAGAWGLRDLEDFMASQVAAMESAQRGGRLLRSPAPTGSAEQQRRVTRLSYRAQDALRADMKELARRVLDGDPSVTAFADCFVSVAKGDIHGNGNGNGTVRTFCASEDGFDWASIESSDGFNAQAVAYVASIDLPGFELSPTSGTSTKASWTLTFSFAPGCVDGYPSSLLVPLLQNPFQEVYRDTPRLLHAQRLLAHKSFNAAEQASPAIYEVWSYAREELYEDLESGASAAATPSSRLRLEDLLRPLLTNQSDADKSTRSESQPRGPQEAQAAGSAKGPKKERRGKGARPVPPRHRDAFFDTLPGRQNARTLEKRERWLASSSGKAIRAVRAKLPSANSKDQLLSALNRNQVIIVSGETGCGKTTQIPQFILEDADERAMLQGGDGHNRASVKIVCTQPRRLAATGVAQRVSEERSGGGPSRDSEVGYKIRGDSAAGSSTRLMFCTTGILLRRLQDDPMIQNVTHVIVDEVHERTLDGDFLLVLLKELLPKRPELKVILMSATIDADKISSYFGAFPSRGAASQATAAPNACPTLFIPGFTYPVSELYLEDLISSIYYQPKLRKKGHEDQQDLAGAETAFESEGQGGAETTGQTEQEATAENDTAEEVAVTAAAAAVGGGGGDGGGGAADGGNGAAEDGGNDDAALGRNAARVSC